MDAHTFANAVMYSRIVSYVTAGSIAILVYDSLLTFEREVRTIWLKKWNRTKFMYVLARYSAFLEAAILICQLSIPGEWYAECLFAFQSGAYVFVFGLGAGEIIMTTRTWAVWNKPRFLTFALPIFFIVIWIGGFTVVGISLKSVKFNPDPRTPYLGCYPTHEDPILFLSWVLLLVYDAVMFALMAIPAFKTYRSRDHSQFLNAVYGDGVMYYFYLFTLSLANIVIALTFPVELLLVISSLSRMIHAILACRVVLHIDEARPFLGSVHHNQHLSSRQTSPAYV